MGRKKTKGFRDKVKTLREERLVLPIDLPVFGIHGTIRITNADPSERQLDNPKAFEDMLEYLRGDESYIKKLIIKNVFSYGILNLHFIMTVFPVVGRNDYDFGVNVEYLYKRNIYTLGHRGFSMMFARSYRYAISAMFVSADQTRFFRKLGRLLTGEKDKIKEFNPSF